MNFLIGLMYIDLYDFFFLVIKSHLYFLVRGPLSGFRPRTPPSSAAAAASASTPQRPPFFTTTTTVAAPRRGKTSVDPAQRRMFCLGQW